MKALCHIIPPTITDLATCGYRKQTLLVQNITDALSNARVESKWLASYQ